MAMAGPCASNCFPLSWMRPNANDKNTYCDCPTKIKAMIVNWRLLIGINGIRPYMNATITGHFDVQMCITHRTDGDAWRMIFFAISSKMECVCRFFLQPFCKRWSIQREWLEKLLIRHRCMSINCAYGPSVDVCSGSEGKKSIDRHWHWMYAVKGNFLNWIYIENDNNVIIEFFFQILVNTMAWIVRGFSIFQAQKKRSVQYSVAFDIQWPPKYFFCVDKGSLFSSIFEF